MTGVAPDAGVAAWRRALGVLGLVLIAIVALYHGTALDMVRIWTRSETFTHGFIVPPLSLWLVWRLRDELAPLTPRPNAWALLALAGASFAWLLAELATVAALAQFALVSMIVFAVPAVLGVAVARRIAFPLAFLYFAVPFGEFALPQLMEWTANFTVFGLRASGIPVYREGLSFVIPSGRWSVVEACSGVRYLIASLSVGTLYAYLTYRSLARRLIFVGVSALVPLIANWARAYMIVMIGHYSGNTLAVGVDHLIYGWLFFGLVICVMFWIGMRWREDEEPVAGAMPSAGPGPIAATAARELSVAVMAVALAALSPLALAQIGRPGVPPERIVVPLEPAGWTLGGETLPSWQPNFANAAATLDLGFTSAAHPSHPVGVHLAYYRDQSGARKMVSSSNTLADARNGWSQVDAGRQRATAGERSFDVRSARLRAAGAPDLVAWQWYWIDGRLTASDTLAKLYTALARLNGHGDDSALIVAYTPSEVGGAGEAALADFVASAWPSIESALQRTREQR